MCESCRESILTHNYRSEAHSHWVKDMREVRGIKKVSLGVITNNLLKKKKMFILYSSQHICKGEEGGEGRHYYKMLITAMETPLKSCLLSQSKEACER